MNKQHILGVGLAAALSLVALPAVADGTTAGTPVNNTALVDYTIDGSNVVDQPSNTTQFLVDRKIDLTVDEVGGAYTLVNTPDSDQALTFTVTNDSNTPLDFALTANQAGILDPHSTPADNPDNFDVSNIRFYEEDGTTPGFQIGEDTLVTFLNEVQPDVAGQRTVYVVSDVAGALTTDDVAAVSLVATAHGDFTGTNGAYVVTAGLGPIATQTGDGVAHAPGTIQTVFVDAADDGTAARDGTGSDRDAYQVKEATLTVVKTQTVISDPTGLTAPNAKAIPGAFVRYSFVVTNNTADTATVVFATDDIPEQTTYDADSIFICQNACGTSVNVTDATGDDIGGHNPAGGATTKGQIEADLGTLAPGQTATFQFNVEID